ncbi:MAG: hypothetical protein KF797_01430 [Flavobacteriales bacterium]|nr:hypothetical protein [Flavobacteriales bacterium]
MFWTACGGERHSDLPIGEVPLTVGIGRLDRDMFAAGDSAQSRSLKAYATYGEFYRTYIEDILQGAPLEDPRLAMVLHRFTTDPDWVSVQEAADSVLGDMEPQRQQFEAAFKRLKVLFPDSLTPRIVAFNSGYNFGIFPTDSVLGVGVEWFIGKDHPVIGYLAPENFPQYVKDRMRPEMLVPSAVKGWLLVHYTRDIRGEDLLTNLVETGKVMALLDALLPDTDPALKLAFSKEQLAWCESNEYNIWKELVSKEQLYSKRIDDIGRWMNDGPFTNGLPRESPGHLGEWIGYRMVKAYLKDHPEVTIPQLLALDDARVVLKSYKPR